MSFGEKIKNIRKDNNLTQEELGNKLYVTRAAVSKWERDLSLPSEDILERICMLYSIQMDDLLDKKDILRNSNNIKRTSKVLMISTIIGGTILLGLIIFLLIAFFCNQDDAYKKYYAYFTGVDDTYLYADTKEGPVSIPKNLILSIEEDGNEVSLDDMMYHDYGLVEFVNNKYNIVITDHEIDGLIASSDACGFLLSFDDELTEFDTETAGLPYYYDVLLGNEDSYNAPGARFASNIFYFYENTPEEITFDCDIDKIIGNEYCVNLYEIVVVNNEFKLRLYKKLEIDSKHKYSFAIPNEKYSKNAIYECKVTFVFNFKKIYRQSMMIYQYDDNMNLLNSVSLDGNYLDSFPVKDLLVQNAFLNILACEGKRIIINSNEAEYSYGYMKYIPYTSGFYRWRE